MCRNRHIFLFQIHTAANCSTLEMQNFAGRKLLCTHKDISLGSFGPVLRRHAAEQDHLISGDITNDRDERDIGLQSIQSLTVKREILISLSQIITCDFIHFQFIYSL